MEQLLAHFAGDYLLQSRWMAEEKLKSWTPAVTHGAVYTLPFLFITTDLRALAVISITHVFIDHFRLAKVLMWARDRLAPASHWTDWDVYRTGYGGKPEYVYFWLMIITDNIMHILINYFAIANWG